MNQINPTATTRERAIAWWNKLGNKEKDRLQRDYELNRNYVTLTGREVEAIWAKEIGLPGIETKN